MRRARRFPREGAARYTRPRASAGEVIAEALGSLALTGALTAALAGGDRLSPPDGPARSSRALHSTRRRHRRGELVLDRPANSRALAGCGLRFLGPSNGSRCRANRPRRRAREAGGAVRSSRPHTSRSHTGETVPLVDVRHPLDDVYRSSRPRARTARSVRPASRFIGTPLNDATCALRLVQRAQRFEAFWNRVGVRPSICGYRPRSVGMLNPTTRGESAASSSTSSRIRGALVTRPARGRCRAALEDPAA